MAVVAAARRLEHHGPAVLAGKGLNGVGHLLSALLLRSADLRPGGLREPSRAHHPPHGELVAGQGQGLRGGLDTDPLGLEPLQKGRVLVLVLESEDRSRFPPESLRQGEAAEWVASVARARAGQGDGRGAGGGGSLGGAAVTSLLVEQAIPFTRELAVLLARTPSGQVAVWPVAQTVQEDGMCAEVLAPAPGLDSTAVEEAELIGRTVAERAGVTGVLAVELFAVETFGEPTRLYVNELAMRPHNSGHWTQDGSVTSQFAQHLRAVLDLPLGATDATAPTTVMVNLIGGQHEPGADALSRAMAAQPEARIHLYGKQWRPGRKLGHVTMTVGQGQEVADVVEQARGAVAILRGDA